MNSDYDITLHSDETSASETARDRFLGFIGLGEGEEDRNVETKAVALTPNLDDGRIPPIADSVGEGLDNDVLDEGVVLSSQPEDFDLLTSESGNPVDRPVSFSADSSSEQTRTGAVLMEQADRLPASAETVEPAVSPDETTGLEKTLSLECPECRGELALHRRHLGIEGVCVWCHTPIVAAESPRDSVVRVFPVLGRIAKPPAAASEPSVDPAPPGIENGEPEAAAENVSPDFGFPSEMTAPPAPTTDLSENPDNAFSTQPEEGISPFDLDALYATSGFGDPAPAAEAPLTNSPSAELGPMRGPASSAPSPPNDIPSFSAATPWGAPARPTDDPPAPAPNAPTDSGPETSGHESLLPSDDLSNDFATSFAANGFGNPGAPSELGGFTAPGQSNPAIDSAAPLTDDFAVGLQASGFALKNAAAPEPTFAGVATEEKNYPTVPEEDVSLDNTSEDKAEFGFFPELPKGGTPDTGWGISEPIGAKFSDDAPVPLASETAFPLGGVTSSFLDDSLGASPTLFSCPAFLSSETPSSFLSGSASTPPHAEMPSMSPSPPDLTDDPAAPVDSPQSPLLQTPGSAFSAITHSVAAVAPNVVFEPLGSKPKPKVRKGFIVLMAVILGFSAGAALASFVLPVGEYVEAARTMMEKKFNPASPPPPLILPAIAAETNPGFLPNP